MLRQIIFGAVVSVCNITIHALVMTLLVQLAQRVSAIRVASPSLLLTAIMVVTVSVLMAAHASEVAVWSAAYSMVDVVPPGISTLYFAFVNYTTLGYGDIIPVKEWQLIGPITAMNGVLMFGWSTAVIFDVLRKAMLLDARTTVLD